MNRCGCSTTAKSTNHEELRADLEAKGHRFRTQSDTEAIVHGYREYGDGIVERLRGMFALAIWDVREKRLILARDRVGQKPLSNYHAGADGLFFASEIKALLEYGGISRDIDPAALADFFTYLWIPEATQHLPRREGNCHPVTSSSCEADGRNRDFTVLALGHDPSGVM